MKRDFLLSSGVVTFLFVLCFFGVCDATDNRPESAAPESPRAADAVYLIGDLAGTWASNGLASGPGAPWWERATITVASDGSFAGTTAESNGGGEHISGTFTISSQGSVTVVGGDLSDADFLCHVNSARTVLACTETWYTGSPGTTEMKVLTRKAASLQGLMLRGGNERL